MAISYGSNRIWDLTMTARSGKSRICVKRPWGQPKPTIVCNGAGLSGPLLDKIFGGKQSKNRYNQFFPYFCLKLEGG